MIWRLLKRILFGLLLLPLLYAAAAGVSAYITVSAAVPAPEAGEGETVYLLSNGVHVNIAVPVHNRHFDWAGYLKQPAWREQPYVYIGWGSRTFYTQVPQWSDLTPQTALKALAFDDSALQVWAGAAPPPSAASRAIRLSAAQYRLLAADLAAQFDGTRPLRDYPDFYPAHGRYQPWLTCNEWMRQRLYRIGVPVPLWSPFDRPLLSGR
ncbi:MAG: DUF2459 domain-containing protein [Eikenella sp.]|nr:DUF2459 domain-containing protein [Eikenella sp.]